MFQSPAEIAFNLFGLPVYYYGIVLAIAISVGFWVAFCLYKNFFDTKDAVKIIDIAPWLIIVGLLGARLYYCLLNFEYYLAHPLEILLIRQGGLSIHGMLVFGVITLLFLVKYYRLDVLKVSDSILCAMPLAQSIGRWGNFFNSEAFGLPTNLPWKLFIPVQNRPIEYLNFAYFHPTFLYESLLDFLVFVCLYFTFKKYYKSSGVISCLYLILYGFVRILVELVRIDSALNLFGIPVAIWVSALLIIVGIVGLIVLKRCQKI